MSLESRCVELLRHDTSLLPKSVKERFSVPRMRQKCLPDKVEDVSVYTWPMLPMKARIPWGLWRSAPGNKSPKTG